MVLNTQKTFEIKKDSLFSETFFKKLSELLNIKSFESLKKKQKKELSSNIRKLQVLESTWFLQEKGFGHKFTSFVNTYFKKEIQDFESRISVELNLEGKKFLKTKLK